MRTSVFVFGTIALLMGGCSSQVGNFSVVAAKNIEFSHKKKVLVKNDVYGDDIKSLIVMFPTGQPQIDKAVSNAVASVGGDYMENAKVSNWFWFIPYVYGRQGFKVVGDVYKLQPDSGKAGF